MKSEITIGLLVSGIADYYPVSVCRGGDEGCKGKRSQACYFSGEVSRQEPDREKGDYV